MHNLASYNSIRLTLLGLLALYCVRCTSTIDDGTYCSYVKRYNPSTDKASSYNLTVNIKNGKLVQLNFPNGGHIDSGEFNPPSVRYNTASFTDHNGVDFQLEIIGKGTECLKGVAKAKRCSASTAVGTTCENMTDNKSGRCHIHQS